MGRKLRKIGWRASDTRELAFTDCRVPAENLLGEPGRGFNQFLAQLERGAAVFPVDDAIAHLEIDRNPLPLLHPARTDGDNLTLGRLLFSCVGDVQAPTHGLRLVGGHNDHPVLQGLQFKAGLGFGSSCHRYDLHYWLDWTN